MSLLLCTSKHLLRSTIRPRRIPHTRLHLTSSSPAKSTAIPSPVSLPTVPAIVSSPNYGLGPVIRLFQRYGNAQRKRPYLTQIWTALTIYILGDLNAQMLSGEENYDPLRTARMCFVGTLIAVPGYRWFMFLNENFHFRSKLLSVAARVVVNQAVFTPVFLVSFFGLQGALTGCGGKEIVEKLEDTVPRAFVNSCRLWPMVTAVNFWIVPFEYRALLSGVVAVGWNGYLSYLSQKTQSKVDVEQLQPAAPTPTPVSVPTPVSALVPVKVGISAGITVSV